MLSLPEKYYTDNRRDEGPSVTIIVKEHIRDLTLIMEEGVTAKNMLDVESKVTLHSIEHVLTSELPYIYMSCLPWSLLGHLLS